MFNILQVLTCLFAIASIYFGLRSMMLWSKLQSMKQEALETAVKEAAKVSIKEATIKAIADIFDLEIAPRYVNEDGSFCIFFLEKSGQPYIIVDGIVKFPILKPELITIYLDDLQTEGREGSKLYRFKNKKESICQYRQDI